MKLKELLSQESRFSREVPIGRQAELLDIPVLLLGVAQAKPPWGAPPGNRLLVMYQMDLLDDEDWDENDEEVTNRQLLKDELTCNAEPDISDINTFIVGGRELAVLDCEEYFLEEENYFLMLLIKSIDRAGKIPAAWLEKDTDSLSVVEYELGPETHEINWEADILNIRGEIEKDQEEVLVEKVLQCNCGQYDVPEKFQFKGKEGKSHEVLIHGIALLDIWENVDDSEELTDLEEFCGQDGRLLVVEYETKEDFYIQFYTKNYLDADANEDSLVSGIYISPRPNSRIKRCVADVVSEDFDGTVEIELFSYYL